MGENAALIRRASSSNILGELEANDAASHCLIFEKVDRMRR